MTPYERFQRIREELDSQNICDSLSDYMTDDDLTQFCDYLEDEFDIEIINEDYDDFN